MGGFRFPLEVVRRLRRQELDAQRRVLAEANRAVANCQHRVARLTADLATAVECGRTFRREGRLDVRLLAATQYHRNLLSRRINQEMEELARKEGELEIEREKLGEAMKSVKVIDKLRERRKLKYDAAMRKQEQGGYDESALQVYVGAAGKRTALQ